MIATPYDDLLHQIANSYGLAYDLLQAQMLVESTGNPNAFRYEEGYFERYILGKDVKGAKYGPLAACSFGLLQILLETALEIGFADTPWRLFEPQVGLAWGAKYLSILLQQTDGDAHRALQRYNGSGPNAVAYADKVFRTAGREG